MKKNGFTDLFPRGERLKILLTMKMFLFFTLALTLSASASIYSQNQRVSLEFSGASVLDIFNEIKEQTGLRFIYNEEKVEELDAINFDVLDMRVDEALEEIFKDTKLECQFYDDVIMVVDRVPELPVKKVEQERKTIKGIVTDKEGNTLPGVSVIIKGTTNGTATDIDGNYSIQFDGDAAVLVFSFVGMISQEIVYSGQVIQNVSLTEDAEMMSEVVVTGYQTISRERATGSVSIVSSDELESKSTSILDKLEGKLPGLQLNITDDFYGNLPSITVRGVATVSREAGQSEPLIVLDGFVFNGSINDINENDIESVVLLKDAAAASIYGAKAGNGVIVISTKKGGAKGLKVEYTGSYSFSQKADLGYFDWASSEDLVDLEVERFNTVEPYYQDRSSYVSNLRPYSKVYGVLLDYNEDADASRRDTRLAALKNIDNRKIKEKYLLQSVSKTKHNLNISGGSEKFKYISSLYYTDSKGLMKDDEIQDYKLSLRADYNISEKLKFSVSGTYLKSEGNKSPYRSVSTLGTTPEVLEIAPYEEIVDPSGNFTSINKYRPSELWTPVQQAGGYGLDFNPISDAQHLKFDNSKDNYTLKASLQFNIFNGAWLEIAHQYQKIESKRYERLGEKSFEMRQLQNSFGSLTNIFSGDFVFNLPQGDRLSVIDNGMFANISRMKLNFSKEIRDKYRVDAVAGFEYNHTKTKNKKDTYFNGVSALDVKVEGTHPFTGESLNNKIYPNAYFAAGAYDIGVYNPYGYSYNYPREKYFISGFFNVNLSYDDRYSISASSRLDASNLNGAKKNNTPFWSVGAKWNLNNEEFFKNDFINRLHLRATYGVNGNVPDIYSSAPFTILRQGNNRNGDFSYFITSPANNSLTWEKTNNLNLGLDLSMLNHRINLSADIYSKISKDVLGQTQVNPSSTGSFLVYKNNGEIINRGLEFSLSVDAIKSKNFNWNSTLSFGYNKNRVEKVSNFEINDVVGRTSLVAGFPFASAFAYKWAGLNNEGVPQFWKGDEKVTNVNDLEFKDFKYMGSYVPSKNVSWNNTFTHKNWSLSLLFVYNGGHVMKLNNYDLDNYSFFGGNFTALNKNITKRWKKPGDEQFTDFHKVGVSNSHWSNSSSQNYAKADYVKLRDLIVSYDINKDWASSIGLEYLTLSFQAKNIYTWTANDQGIDPEAHQITQGKRVLPIMPSYLFGVKIGF